MGRSDKPTPMKASAPLTQDSTSRGGATPYAEAATREGYDPEAILREIRERVTDDLTAARQLAAEAADRFPDHHGLAKAHRVLNQGKASLGTGRAEPTRDQELDWLRHPPDSVRGRWVALFGSKLVASAEKLAEVMELLRAKNLESQALVHRIDA